MQPREDVVYDRPHPCSYLSERTARLPYRQPLVRLKPAEFDQRLAEGDRRSGTFLFRVCCLDCRACQPIRLYLARFQPNATQRRTKRRGDEHLEAKIGKPMVDEERIRLFNLHRDTRGLARDDAPIDAFSYAEFLT